MAVEHIKYPVGVVPGRERLTFWGVFVRVLRRLSIRPRKRRGRIWGSLWVGLHGGFVSVEDVLEVSDVV